MTYKELTKILAEREFPTMGRNQDFELVLIEEGREDGRHFYRLTASQENGWLRVNTYYEDGSTDETYRK